jgi:two-component system, chemotaxis family, CheB/CheR fusion protein
MQRSRGKLAGKKPSRALVTGRPDGASLGRASPADGFPIVGIGASAGGLEAFTRLLSLLPADTGMAFVLIQHLDPTRASFLPDALSRVTTMPVVEAEDGAQMEPSRVYVIPPSADVALEKGKLRLRVRGGDGRGSHLPVDLFLLALAQERGNRAIGVVLSGTASDGTEGLRAIKAAGGITLAQDPQSAKFGGMPRSAVDAGVVDHCLPLSQLAEELVRLSRHPYLSAGRPGLAGGDGVTLRKILRVVRDAVGVDFAEYKRPTLERRIARRMTLSRAQDLPAYLRILEADSQEIRALYEDTLIHVTSFFRDLEVFEQLKSAVFPKILRHKAEGAPIRIWVAGCSTGEEVYSLAIVLLEYLQAAGSNQPVQIFGSDVSDRAIERARGGTFPDSAMREVSQERRQRYFTKTDSGFRINKAVRDLCVFVRHDLARDPPFSKLDLASCRNVLIYFDQVLQRRIIATFHHCLREPGFLLLGRTEAISGFSQLFSPVDKAHKIFARTAAPSQLHFAPGAELFPAGAQSGAAKLAVNARAPGDMAKHLDRLLLARFAPPAVLVTAKLDVLQFRGQTGIFLQPAAGEPQSNLLKMARPGLMAPLRAAITQAKKEMAPVRKAVEIEEDGVVRACEVVVIPFTGPLEPNERLFLVLFENSSTRATSSPATRGGQRRRPTPAQARDGRRMARMENEMAATRDYLQSLIEEHSQATDDLGSANEELVSGNEELQSLNEELETAKEELQSTNEELTTLNDELQNRNQEVNLANTDLVNLLSTVDIPILIVDRERRIRRFTPKARRILNVVARDIGRPFDDIRPNLSLPHLDAEIAQVIERMEMKESEVQDIEGHWHRLQIRPYQGADGRVDGAILSLVDIDALKHHVAVAEEAKAEAERANRAKDEFLATLSHELRTPLGTMLLEAQLLRRIEVSPERVAQASEKIERGVRMQVQLIEDLLDVSRIVTGKMEMETASVDLVEVVRAAVEGVAVAAARKPVTLTVSLDKALGPMRGNSTRLQQVVSNLLTNAVKFTHEGGEVRVVLERADGRALLRVSDNGRGIEPAFLPHLFRRFSQEDSSVTRTHGGLGLGLAIAHHLVGLHGGTIRAESAGAGQGATFMVSLPLERSGREEAGQGVLEPVAPGSSPPDGSALAPALARQFVNLRVLVVDDDAGTRDALLALFEAAGAVARGADSAVQGLAAVEDFRPAVVLCDIAMPGEDGYSFIRRMRALGPGRGGLIPALALTALAGEEDRQRALSAGFQMHVAKPVDIRRLTEAVAEVSRSAMTPAPVLASTRT